MNKNIHHQEETQVIFTPHHDKKPRWKRIHHTWGFWIFLLLMFAAILYYIYSVNFAFAPL